MYKCQWPGCQQAFPFIYSLNKHLDSHKIIDHQQEEKCEDSLITNKNGIIRSQSYNLLAKYRCQWPQCGERFPTLESLRSHLLSHKEIKPNPRKKGTKIYLILIVYK